MLNMPDNFTRRAIGIKERLTSGLFPMTAAAQGKASLLASAKAQSVRMIDFSRLLMLAGDAKRRSFQRGTLFSGSEIRSCGDSACD
jgi:hypothetical protein